MFGVTAPQFWAELLQRSLKAMLQDLGTSGLGWLVAVGVPILVASVGAAQAESGKRIESLRAKWQTDVRITLLVYAGITLQILVWECFWGVPHTIYREAASAPDPSIYVPKVSKADPVSQIPHTTDQLSQSHLQKSDIQLLVSVNSPEQPAIVVENPSNKLAENVTWELVMVRLRDHAFFSFAIQNIGYTKAHSKSAPYSMELNKIPKAPEPSADMVRDGDDFVGSLVIDCPFCTGTTLIVSFKWGHSGWFIQLPDGNGHLILPKDMTNEKVDKYINVLSSLDPSQRKIIQPLQQ